MYGHWPLRISAKSVPDNAKSGLTKPSYYNPVVNRGYHNTFLGMAALGG